MKKITVELYSAASVPDNEGVTSRGLTFSTELKGLLLPSDTILSSEGYSLKEDTSYRFFCKQKHDDIKAGNVIVADGRQFTIVHVSDYQKIRIIYISTEVNKEGRRSFSGTLRY